MNKLSFLFLAFSFFQLPLQAQEVALSSDFKKTTVLHMEELLNERYVFPDVAKKIGEHLRKQLESGFFDSCNDLATFAKSLDKEVQSINNDKHLGVRARAKKQEPSEEGGGNLAMLLSGLEDKRSETGGFKAVEKLKGNIGYLKINHFAPPEEGAAIADLYMELLSTSDVIIIDLRENGGGSPGMVQYLCSYFFDKKVHLNSLYWREGDRTQDFWTVPVQGKKLPEVPLFVLTSNYTFSGAEEFSYNMQTQKRATLVGETTGGGANPGGPVPINDNLRMFIPTGKAINPITKTNWEGVGVVPTVATTKEEALNKAVELATIAAESYREKQTAANKLLMKEYTSCIEKIEKSGWNETSEASLLQALTKCKEAELFGEADINMFGYDYLQQKNLLLAEAMFKSNTVLFPNSGNAYDSYGEALLAASKIKPSIAAYQKAVVLATENQSPQLEMIQENLKNAKEAAKKR